MHSLQKRLESLENATGSEIWEILKESEDDIRQNLDDLNAEADEKVRKNREILENLRKKREELKNIKKDVESLRIEYGSYVESVEMGLKASGLEMKDVVRVFERVLEESQAEKNVEILKIIDSTEKSSTSSLRDPLRRILALKTANFEIPEVQKFGSDCREVFRRELWSRMNFPIDDGSEISEDPGKMKSLVELCQFSIDLDELIDGNHEKSIRTLTETFFSQISMFCVDLIQNDKDVADFEWILANSTVWTKNLRKIVEKSISLVKIDARLVETWKSTFDATFIDFLNRITKQFLRKNIKEPMIFSNMTSLLRNFDENSEFDLSGNDIFEPFYDPEILGKWILLEVELFQFSLRQLLLQGSAPFRPLSAIEISESPHPQIWASEITVFIENWLIRQDHQLKSLEAKPDAQNAFLEIVISLIIDFSSKLRETARNLESSGSWSTDVYMVMNSTWQIQNMVRRTTDLWPISAFEAENSLKSEWHRLARMISDYLTELCDRIEQRQESVDQNFFHIMKCLNNVTVKASGPSKNQLLNILAKELFENLQILFDKWKNSCGIEVLSSFYQQIYSNLIPRLDYWKSENIWIPNSETRSEMCNLDALMKMAANRDPSGELVRTAFKSIDEEQVLKMLAELGIHSTSDHAFQDFQILAENWEKLKGKM